MGESIVLEHLKANGLTDANCTKTKMDTIQ